MKIRCGYGRVFSNPQTHVSILDKKGNYVKDFDKNEHSLVNRRLYDSYSDKRHGEAKRQPKAIEPFKARVLPFDVPKPEFYPYVKVTATPQDVRKKKEQ